MYWEDAGYVDDMQKFFEQAEEMGSVNGKYFCTVDVGNEGRSCVEFEVKVSRDDIRLGIDEDITLLHFIEEIFDLVSSAPSTDVRCFDG